MSKSKYFYLFSVVRKCVIAVSNSQLNDMSGYRVDHNGVKLWRRLRSVPELNDLLRNGSFGWQLRSIFVNMYDYSPYLIEKYSSTSHTLATITVLRQSPGAVKRLSPCRVERQSHDMIPSEVV